MNTDSSHAGDRHISDGDGADIVTVCWVVLCQRSLKRLWGTRFCLHALLVEEECNALPYSDVLELLVFLGAYVLSWR